METHFLSSSRKKDEIPNFLVSVSCKSDLYFINPFHFVNFAVKHIGNDMWDVATERRYTKLVEKLHMLSSSSLYLRQVEHHRVISLGVIIKVVTDQQDLVVQEVEHQDNLEKIRVVLQQSISRNLRFKPNPLVINELLGFIFSKFKIKLSCILSYFSKICNA
ncbi:hypothetical protein MKW92_014662 [Papaver armeniacum]|nr:hypothetical protein MKW92_014662 [Papaver armeniacum]